MVKKNLACNIKLPKVAMSPAAALACDLLSRCSLDLAGGGSVYFRDMRMT